jgi:hypothetical protein
MKTDESKEPIRNHSHKQSTMDPWYIFYVQLLLVHKCAYFLNCPWIQTCTKNLKKGDSVTYLTNTPVILKNCLHFTSHNIFNYLCYIPNTVYQLPIITMWVHYTIQFIAFPSYLICKFRKYFNAPLYSNNGYFICAVLYLKSPGDNQAVK